VGYPLILVLLRAVIRRPVEKRAVEPSVSLLVAAHNEEAVIEAKIRNALALEYPSDRLEIVIASDGSTDRTAEIVRSLADGHRIRLLEFETNRGKLAVLNDSVPQLRSEIVAFSDASSMLDRHAIRNLVENFADPKVGAVSGVYRVENKNEARLGNQEDAYWKYETFLKSQEAALASVLGAHGSLYAIRRLLYPFPKPGTINDDYVIPVRIVGRGYRVAYEPGAVAYEEASEMAGFARRVRIMTGNVRQLREIRALVWPPRILELFFVFSHKVGRLIVPPAAFALAISNVFLLGSAFYAWSAALQIAFYSVAVFGAFFHRSPRVLRLPCYFCMLNAAAVFGIYHALRSNEVAWRASK
jgi:hypothetical protein